MQRLLPVITGSLKLAIPSHYQPDLKCFTAVTNTLQGIEELWGTLLVNTTDLHYLGRRRSNLRRTRHSDIEIVTLMELERPLYRLLRCVGRCRKVSSRGWPNRHLRCITHTFRPDEEAKSPA